MYKSLFAAALLLLSAPLFAHTQPSTLDVSVYEIQGTEKVLLEKQTVPVSASHEAKFSHSAAYIESCKIAKDVREISPGTYDYGMRGQATPGSDGIRVKVAYVIDLGLTDFVAEDGCAIQLKNLALTEHELTLIGNSTITSTKLAGRNLVFEISAN